MTKIKKPSKKVLLVLAALIVLAGAGGAFYFNKANNSGQTAQNPTIQEGKINLDPPTEEDAKRVDANKKKVEARQEQEKIQAAAPPSSSKKQVKPVITYAGQYGQAVEVGAGVNGIFEDGGVCTATFSKGALSFTKSVNAVKNMSAVDCPVMSAGSGEFAQKGVWNITVNYSSATAAGDSDARQVEVK